MPFCPGYLQRSGADAHAVTGRRRPIEDVRGEPFEETARRLIFEPLEMTRSSFRQPPESLRSPSFADWRFYPERAAAGLWTTPGDLARFVCALQAALKGDAAGLTSATTMAMTTRHAKLPLT